MDNVIIAITLDLMILGMTVLRYVALWEKAIIHIRFGVKDFKYKEIPVT